MCPLSSFSVFVSSKGTPTQIPYPCSYPFLLLFLPQTIICTVMENGYSHGAYDFLYRSWPNLFFFPLKNSGIKPPTAGTEQPTHSHKSTLLTARISPHTLTGTSRERHMVLRWRLGDESGWLYYLLFSHGWWGLREWGRVVRMGMELELTIRGFGEVWRVFGRVWEVRWGCNRFSAQEVIDNLYMKIK